MIPEALIERAEGALEQAYQPYSGYSVGVALQTTTGEVFLGCNVENAAYTPTTHGEQTAFVTAIANGHREFDSLALVTEGRDGSAPCGFCRQIIHEFVGDDFPIYSATESGYEEYTLGELLPAAFGPGDVLDDAP